MTVTAIVGRDETAAQVTRLLDRNDGVLLVGAAGVGKSALATMIGDGRRLAGWHVETIRCSRMTASLAFAPLMHFLPSATGGDPTQTSNMIVQSIVSAAGEKPLLLVIDDLQHSDPGTASVIFSLLTQHDTHAIASTRTRATNQPSVHQLWKDGHLTRIDLEPLDSRSVAQLTAALLECPPDTRLASELYARAAGNPFYTTSLVRAGMASGSIQKTDGHGTLAEPLPPSSEVNDVLRAQLSSLSAHEHSLIQLIAVGENMPFDLLGDADDQQAIMRLVDAGLVVIDRASASRPTRCAHPLIGEYLRGQMAPRLTADVHASLISRVGEYGDASAADRLRAVALGIESDVPMTNELLLDAAATALNFLNLDLAKAAVQRSLDDQPSGQAHLLLGTALAMGGEVAEANRHFDLARGETLSNDQIAELAIAEGNLALFFEFDPERGFEILSTTFEALPVSAAKARVGSSMTMPLLMLGGYRQADDLCTEVAEYPDIDPATELHVLGMLVMTRFLGGRFPGLDALVERALSIVASPDVFSTIMVTQAQLGEDISAMAKGNFAGLRESIANKIDLYALEQGAGGVSAGWSSLLATSQVLTGDITDALAHTAVAIERVKIDDPLGMAPMAIATRAAILCAAGRDAEARAVIETAPSEPYEIDPRSAIWKAWVETWLTATTDPVRAGQVAAQASQVARDFGLNYWAWNVLYAAVLVDQAAAVVDQFEADHVIAQCVQSDLMARHARAATDHDTAGLASVASDFASHSAWTSAATAYAQASAIEAPTDAAAANRLMVQAAFSKEQTKGIRTLVLDRIENPLTEPEYQVALLAGGGASSKQIAEQRFVSARTVDNQLRSVYKKLGLRGRADLADLF